MGITTSNRASRNKKKAEGGAEEPDSGAGAEETFVLRPMLIAFSGISAKTAPHSEGFWESPTT